MTVTTREVAAASGTGAGVHPWPRWHGVRIKAQGPLVEVWLDDSDEPTVEAKDEALTVGYIGLGATIGPTIGSWTT